MTTIPELVDSAPAPTHGKPIQLAATSGVWRFSLELADPLAGTDIEWHDLTAFYVSDRDQRGADEYMGRYRAMVAQVMLQVDREVADALDVPYDILAPWGQDTSALFGDNVVLDAGLLMRAALGRVAGGVTVDWYPLWTGRVETWGDMSSARGQLRTHTVTVVDTIGDLVNVPVPSVGYEPWDEAIDTALGFAQWVFGWDIYGDDTLTPDVPPLADQPSAINLLDNIADPYGIVWRSRRNGRLVFHPAPWDVLHSGAAAWPNPTLAAYPGGLVFNYNPQFTDVAYDAADDDQPFGLTRTSVGVVNTITATTPGGVYPVDDPTSISKFGVKPLAFSWIVENDAAVDQLLDARAFATVQALPLTTSVDRSGFFPAMALADHLDPVTIVHANRDDGIVVTATGQVRNVASERSMRAADADGNFALSWRSVVQFDIDSTETSVALLPVEDLALDALFVGSATFTWSNPSGQPVTPTDTQIRILGLSSIWIDWPYPMTSWMMGPFTPSTSYTMQVRLVRRVNGIVTHSSPVRQVEFVTPPPWFPTPIPDGEDTDAEIPDFADEDCEMVVELQENADDGYGWVTVDTFSGSELVDNGNGTFGLAYPIENSFFNEGSMYRFRSGEDCGSGVDEWFDGPAFDPPDDWTDPCPAPAAVASAPFDDPDLLVYVPQVCPPNIIAEAVSGIHGTWGSAIDLSDGIVQELGNPGQFILQAVPQPAWDAAPGGIIAWGECPQITGVTGDKTIAARVMITDATESVVLFECGAMRLTCVPTTGGWRAAAVIYTPGSTITLPSDTVLDVDTEYTLRATFEAATGDVKLYVDDIEDGDHAGSGPDTTINAFAIWRVGAPPESWVTDCAVWSKVLTPADPPPDPTFVGKVTDSNLNGSIALVKDGNYCYVAAFSATRLTVVDVSTPGTPSVVGSVSVSGGGSPSVGGVAKDGNYCYVSVNVSSNGVLKVVDVSTPSSPTVVGTSGSSSGMNAPRGVVKSGNYCYVAGQDGDALTVVDVSNPASPSVVGSVTHANLDSARNLVKIGNYCYVTALNADRVTVVDVSTPASPSVVGSVTHAHLDQAYGITTDGTYLYVTAIAAKAIVVIDISTPTSPSVAGSYVDAGVGDPLGIAVDGGYAFVASSTQLNIYDVSNPAAPTLFDRLIDATNLAAASPIDYDSGAVYVGAFATTGSLTVVGL